MAEDPAEVHIAKHLATFVDKQPDLERGRPYLLEAVVIPQGGRAVFIQSYQFKPLSIVVAKEGENGTD